MRPPILATALLAIGAALPGASHAERIQMFWSSHLPKASGVETVYAATCQDVRYQLAVSGANRTVVLRAENRPDVDLAATTVGQRLLEQDVLVHVGFNCPRDAINIFLKGVKLIDLGAPKGFRDSVSVRANGEVGAGLPEEVPVSEMASPPPGTTVRTIPDTGRQN